MRIDEDYVADRLVNVIADLTGENRETTKQVLRTMIDQIILDPVCMEYGIHYKIGVDSRNKMASPRGVEPLLPA